MEETGTSQVLVPELIEGEDLSDRIARGPIPVDEALKVALQIAEALEAAQEKGIVHRDLKPANIKITPEGQGVQGPGSTTTGPRRWCTPC